MVVDHFSSFGVVIHGVDGEVASCGIFILRAPNVVAQDATAGVHGMLHASEFLLATALITGDLRGIGVVEMGAEGGDFDHLMLTPPAIHNMDDAKASAYDECAAKSRLHLLRRGVGGNVKVFGLQAQQQVTDRATDDIGFEATFLQGTHHIQGTFIHPIAIDAMDIGLHHLALAQRGLFAGGFFTHQLVDKLFDHEVGNSSRIGQPLSKAKALSLASGLVATGWLTRSSRGMSLLESL